MSKKYVIGIDLGTTKSVVSIFEDGVPKIIENLSGERITPSFVALKKPKKGSDAQPEWLVGKNAKNQAVANPLNTIYGVKRLIGRRFDDPNVKKMQELAPYKIVAGPNGDAWVEIDGQKMAPAQVSAKVLRELKLAAEKYLGKDKDGNQIEVKDAVITCPAYFNDAQIKATENAGEIAGLKVLRVVKEPTAAALAYGLEKKRGGKVIVYDLGGGTFDVSVLDVMLDENGQGMVEVKAVDGDTFLGGENFDERIQDRLIEVLKEEHGLDLSEKGADLRALQRIRDAAEKLKVELSTQTEAEVNIPFIGNVDGEPVNFEYKMRRSELEDLVKDLIERTQEPCKRALENAGIKISEIDEVLLVGAQTRMPKVAEFVKNFFGKEPRQDLSVQEIVAMGAAVQGAILSGEVDGVLLLDVIPLSIGVRTAGDSYFKMVERNSTIPMQHTETFKTSEDNQDNLSIQIYQGERPKASDNKLLSKFIVPLPPGLKQLTDVRITFKIDENGTLDVEAAVAGKVARAKVQANGGLSEAEVAKMLKDAEDNAEKDRVYKEGREAAFEAETRLKQAENDIEQDYYLQAPEDLKTAFDAAVSGLKEAVAQKNPEATIAKLAELKEARSKMGEAFQAASNPPAENAEGGEAPAPEGDTEAPKGPAV